MKARTLTVITMLLDLKAAALKLLRSDHRNPALLNFYTLIDICASLSNENKQQSREIFETFLSNFAEMTTWEFYSTYDLWSARCSLVHTYSPFGYHTNKQNNGARPIFYYSWAEEEPKIRAALEKRGYSDFILLDTEEIKTIAIDAFNTMYKKITEDPEFEKLFIKNAKHLLPSLQNMRFEDELSKII
ncbi:hypothetical protein ACM66Z_07545 [Sulfurovum sp. ST-21]|uniref:Uncharacterized protein n=1 Tax=Sulfurovum indicum TaxID=2779528 RepID=A0A7M1S4L2_9BACT|nr:hypothetical protein [Sulfurovum indicum]QOR61300.1 hypothetical protein IMZ28_07540 [Sulfurovum indicum]